MPRGVDAEQVASVEIAGLLTAATGGTHYLGIRGIGEFTLTAGGQTLFDGTVRPDSDDLAMVFLSPPERRIGVEATAGTQLTVVLTQRVRLTRALALVSVSLCYSPPIVADDDLLAEAEEAAARSDVAIVVVGTTEQVESEGFDRTTLALPGRQDELVRRVAAANRNTLVVVNAGSPVELPWAGQVAAILLAWFPGQEAGHALADVLLGVTEPGGRLPTTWPATEADCPVLSVTPRDGVLRYDEGVFIGYRAFERAGTIPRFSFGHGLGYTSWQYEQLTADDEQVTVTVRNSGGRPGREVVQVYAGAATADAAAGELERPRRWLAGFAAVEAGPGEAVTVTVPLPERTFQIWDSGWRTITGSYAIEAAHSLADVRLTATITVG